MSRIRPTSLLFAALLLAGCRAVPVARQEETTLYFGMGGVGKTVTAAQWDAFVANEIATRFPDGFTSSTPTATGRRTASVTTNRRAWSWSCIRI